MQIGVPTHYQTMRSSQLPTILTFALASPALSLRISTHAPHRVSLPRAPPRSTSLQCSVERSGSDEAETALRPPDYSQLLSLLAAGDAAALLLFAAIGRGNHDTATGNVLTTAAPFLLSWAALAPPLGAYAGQRPATLREAATVPVLAWAVAVPCGCALRGVLNDRMPAAPFWIVALIATKTARVSPRSSSAPY